MSRLQLDHAPVEVRFQPDLQPDCNAANPFKRLLHGTNSVVFCYEPHSSVLPPTDDSMCDVIREAAAACAVDGLVVEDPRFCIY